MDAPSWPILVVVAALLGVQANALPGDDRVVMLEVRETQPLPQLHAQNNQLLQQIESLTGNRPPNHAAPGGAPPGPAGPMPAMPAMPTGGATTGRMQGIKEALTAVKPIMDKYVNTAKTLTGKYSSLKKAYQMLKTAKGKVDPAMEAKLKETLTETKDEDKKKYDELESKYEQLEEKETQELQTEKQKEMSLKQQNVKLSTNNEAVAHAFTTELAKARKEAKGEVQNMRVELNRFMADSQKDQFNSLGEATEKALEEKKTLDLKTPAVVEDVKKMLHEEAEKDAEKDDEEDWGDMEDEDAKPDPN